MKNKYNVVPSLVELLGRLDAVRPDPANPRLHEPANIAVIARSLERFGQDQPLVARRGNGTLIKGHGRHAAMAQLGWTHAAIVYVTDSATEALARSVADNRASDTSGWDYAALADVARTLAKDGQDIHELGWDAGALRFILPDDVPATALEPFVPAPPPARGEGLRLTVEQRQSFEQAYAVLRRMIGGNVSEGRALELICADFVSSNRG